MTCDRVRELASGLIDGELDPKAADAVRDHLAGCPACAEHLQSLADLADIFTAGSTTPAPTRIWDRIAAEATLVAAPTRRSLPRARRWAAVAAAAIIVVALPVYVAVFHAVPAAPDDGSSAHTAPAGLALATFVREIQSGADEPEEFLALHQSREVDLAELPEHVDFEPRFPSCIPAGLTMNKCYVLRIADGTAIGCSYRNGSRRMMVFQQRAGEPIQCEGLAEAPVDRCGLRCRSLVSGSVTVLSWEGEGRATTVVCREVDAAEIDGLLNSMIAENE